MRLPFRMLSRSLVLLTAVALTGCEAEEDGVGNAAPGVDMEARVVRLGALNDESGPAASIGRPFAQGVRIAVQQSNAGELGILPEGWRVELVERDHAYNPQRSVQAYNEIRDRVLFFAVSFGTPNTLPLQSMLQRDNTVAFPASLSSQMAQHRYTPPVAPSYHIEAQRALDWAIEHAGGAGAVRPGIVYQQDDYGQDGLDGLRHAAAHHGISIVSEQAVAPGQTDMTAVISRLRADGANYVLLTTLPSTTGPLLGTAAQLNFSPVWIGQTPAWIDGFFDPTVMPPAVFSNFYWVMGTPYWGEDVPGMDALIAAHDRFGGEGARPDYWKVFSYVQTKVGLEAFARALEAGNPTREGFLQGLQSIEGWDSGGMIQPVSFAQFPYVTGTRTRVLRPVLAERRWEVVAPYAEPSSLGARN
jgi:ABC-type branched-subunit amino acid transport system substrate-binding protein